MAVMNQIYNILNTSQKQAWGDIVINVVDTSTMISLGDYILNSANATSKDLWTGSLTDLIGKTVFVSRQLQGDDLGISRDEFEYGAIMRKIRIKPIELRHNTEYDLGTQSFNPFEIITPTVSEQLYSNFGTYESLITITDQQLFTAFKSDAEMMAFYSLIYKQQEDAMRRGQWNYDRLALATFIANKINLQTTQPTKTHAINLLAQYNKEKGTELTVAQAKLSDDFWRFVARTMILYKGYLAQESNIFNASPWYKTQTTDPYLNFYMLTEVEALLNTILYSDTYHKELVEISGYHKVPFWQGISTENTTPFSFENNSAISIKLKDGTEITKSGIIAVMSDVDAIATTYKTEKAESWRVYTKGTNHYKSVTQMLINDLWENGVIFYIEDEPEPEPEPQSLF